MNMAHFQDMNLKTCSNLGAGRRLVSSRPRDNPDFGSTKWGLLVLFLNKMLVSPSHVLTSISLDFPGILTYTPYWYCRSWIELPKSTRQSWRNLCDWPHSKWRLTVLKALTQNGPPHRFHESKNVFCSCKLQASTLDRFSRKKTEQLSRNGSTLNRSVHWDVDVKTNKMKSKILLACFWTNKLTRAKNSTMKIKREPLLNQQFCPGIVIL